MTDQLSDLVAQLPQMEQKMKAWFERYQQRYKAREAEYERSLRSRRMPPLSEYQRAFEGLANMAQQETDPGGLREIYAYLNRLCLSYLAGDESECRQARETIAAQAMLRSWLPRYVSDLTEAIQSKADEDRLRIALAALSLENATFYPGLTPRWQEDYRDVGTSLAPLRQAAERAGLDILPHLKTTAGLSSAQPSWVAPNSPSLREYLLQVAGDIEAQRRRAAAAVICPDISPLGTPATSLVADTPASGQVTDETPTVAFQFQARKGHVVTVKMQRAGGNLEPFVGLVDVRGTILTRGTGSNPALITGFAIPADGCYYVFASCRGVGSGATKGTFHLVASGFKW